MVGLAWIYRGPLANGQFQEMPDEDLQQAILDDWAQDALKTGDGLLHPSVAFKPIMFGHHAAAEAYAARKSGGGYSTRELKAGDPPAPAPAEKVEPEVEAKPKPAVKPKGSAKK